MNATSSRGARTELLMIRERAQAAVLLQPQRPRLLEALTAPDSAAGLARRLRLPRQQVNYHLRELERAGLVELVEERRRGNCVERVMVAAARRYVISPEVLGELGADAAHVGDRFSPDSLLAAAARAIRDLGELRANADERGERLATMTLESEVRFASVDDRNAFAKELSDALARLVVKYHSAAQEENPGFRVVVSAYPADARRSEPQPEGRAPSGG